MMTKKKKKKNNPERLQIGVARSNKKKVCSQRESRLIEPLVIFILSCNHCPNLLFRIVHNTIRHLHRFVNLVQCYDAGSTTRY